MATLEQILEEAKKLPPEEQRRLRAALAALGPNGDTQPAYRTHEQERAWINAHRDEYLDQWVALDVIACWLTVTTLKKSTMKQENKASQHPILSVSHPNKRPSWGAGSDPSVDVRLSLRLWD